MVQHRAESETLTSLSLLSRVRRGDGEAWFRFFALYEPLLSMWCARFGLRGHQADDVKQEVFIEVKKSLAKFKKESERDSFRGWLRTITASKVANHWREKDPAATPIGGTDPLKAIAYLPAPVQIDSDELSEDKTLLSEEQDILYRRAIELIKTDFESKTWMAFWRTVVDGVVAGDVAHELGITRSAVHSAKARVLRRLREEFFDLLEDRT